MPVAILLCGPPGCGKSTFQKQYLPDFHVVSSDKIIEQYASANNITYNTGWDMFKELATKEYYEHIEHFVKYQRSFVSDRTNISEKARKAVLQKVPTNWKKIAIYFPALTPMRLIARIAERPEQHVPDEAVHKLWSSYEVPRYSEGFDLVLGSSEMEQILKVMTFK